MLVRSCNVICNFFVRVSDMYIVKADGIDYERYYHLDCAIRKAFKILPEFYDQVCRVLRLPLRNFQRQIVWRAITTGRWMYLSNVESIYFKDDADMWASLTRAMLDLMPFSCLQADLRSLYSECARLIQMTKDIYEDAPMYCDICQTNISVDEANNYYRCSACARCFHNKCEGLPDEALVQCYNRDRKCTECRYTDTEHKGKERHASALFIDLTNE